MGFTLNREPAPAGLQSLGGVVDLRELAYGAMRDTMAQSEHSGESGERLLGACLYVDDQAIGYEGLRALPGRYAGGIAAALEAVMRLHGLLRATDEPDEPGPNV